MTKWYVSFVHDFVAPANPGFQVLARDLGDAIRRGPGDRFCYYAKRLKTLEICYSFVDPSSRLIDPRLFHLWTTTNEVRFPLLCSLTFSDFFMSISEYPHIASLIRALLGLSPIKDLSLRIFDSEVDHDLVQAELRHEILDVCRNLERLSVCDGHDSLEESGEPVESTTWSYIVGDMISHATQLRHCTVALPITVVDLSHMSTLENLTSLAICEVTPALDHPFALPAGSFVRLEKLEVAELTTSASVTRSILSFPPNGCLKQIILKYYQLIHMDHIHDIRSLLGRHLTLSSISFIPSIWEDAAIDSDIDLICEQLEGMVEFLPPLPHLMSLEMKAPGRATIDFPLIEGILQLYPSLRSVDLDNYCLISLTELLNILGAHPLLTKLPICIRDSELPPLSTMLHPERFRFGPSLGVMDDADSPTLRQAIKALFPNVDTLCLHHDKSFWSIPKIIELRA
jgi:hypothetical protein